MNANSISVHNLRKHFPGFLLDDISFQVPCGRIVGFIGENGAGKSTTIKLILDQLRRDGGSIEIFGTPLFFVKQQQDFRHLLIRNVIRASDHSCFLEQFFCDSQLFFLNEIFVLS